MTQPISVRSFLMTRRYNNIQMIVFTILLSLALILIAREQQQRAFLELTRVTPLLKAEIVTDTVDIQNPYQKNYSFTSDWFTSKLLIWRKVLEPFAHAPDIQYLEVGVYEGRAMMWMVENVLTHPSSRLTGMDIFSGDYEDHYGSYKDRYLANLKLSGAASRATTIEGFSQIELRKLPIHTYHIIYIDGSHVNADVLEDAILSWRLLKKGGVMIFDDYGDLETTDPKGGINAFMKYFGSHFDVLHNGMQLIVRKKG